MLYLDCDFYLVSKCYSVTIYNLETKKEEWSGCEIDENDLVIAQYWFMEHPECKYAHGKFN